jgi:hypothetical protein
MLLAGARPFAREQLWVVSRLRRAGDPAPVGLSLSISLDERFPRFHEDFQRERARVAPRAAQRASGRALRGRILSRSNFLRHVI